MVQELEFKQKTGKTFEEFYKKYKPSLINYLRRFTNDMNTVKDVADETLIKTLEEIHKFDPVKSQITTWVFTCAKNAMLYEIKKNQRLQVIDETTELGYTGLNYSSEREEILTQKQVSLMRKSMYNLPDKYSRLLVMRLIDGLSYNDITALENIPLNTIKSRIKHAKLLLIKNTKFEMNNLIEDYA